MLIANNGIKLTDHGIKIVGIDGSHIELSAWDTLKLRKWLLSKEDALTEVLRRASYEIDKEEKGSTRHAEHTQDPTPDIP